MKNLFTPYNIIRFILLVIAIVFLALHIFYRKNGERNSWFLAIGLAATAIANFIIFLKRR